MRDRERPVLGSAGQRLEPYPASSTLTLGDTFYLIGVSGGRVRLKRMSDISVN